MRCRSDSSPRFGMPRVIKTGKGQGPWRPTEEELLRVNKFILPSLSLSLNS